MLAKAGKKYLNRLEMWSFKSLKSRLFRVPNYILIIGVFLSVLLHELTHVLLHIGEISKVALLPNPFTIVELTLTSPEHYDLAGEELLAYLVSALTIIITMYFFDKSKPKTVETADTTQKLGIYISRGELLILAKRANLL